MITSDMRTFVGITKLKSKIHRATVTDANTQYEGSITIDGKLLRLAHIAEYEKVDVYNITNGERFSTYAIEGKNGEGDVCVNGAAAKKVTIGDKIIICSYALMDISLGFNEFIGKYGSSGSLKKYEPYVVYVDDENKVKEK
jgi:aspartate 1-decarboxylase